MAWHLGTTMWERGSEWKHRNLAATASHIEAITEFWVWNQVLDKVDTFKYMDRMMFFDESDFPVVERNLQR